MNEKITMTAKHNLTIREAQDLFIRKCKVKNLAEKSITDYINKLTYFGNFCNYESPVKGITKDTVDDYIIFLRENSNANDITINSYLRSVRALLFEKYNPLDNPNKPKSTIKM